MHLVLVFVFQGATMCFLGGRSGLRKTTCKPGGIAEERYRTLPLSLGPSCFAVHAGTMRAMHVSISCTYLITCNTKNREIDL